jgi:hypothetical protein
MPEHKEPCEDCKNEIEPYKQENALLKERIEQLENLLELAGVGY